MGKHCCIFKIARYHEEEAAAKKRETESCVAHFYYVRLITTFYTFLFYTLDIEWKSAAQVELRAKEFLTAVSSPFVDHHLTSMSRGIF